MAFDTTHISDLNTKRLISNLTVSFAVAFSRSVVLPLPFKFVFGFIIFLLSFFFCSRRWFVHKVHTEFVLAFFAQQCSKWKIFISETYLWYWETINLYFYCYGKPTYCYGDLVLSHTVLLVLPAFSCKLLLAVLPSIPVIKKSHISHLLYFKLFYYSHMALTQSVTKYSQQQSLRWYYINPLWEPPFFYILNQTSLDAETHNFSYL